MEVVLRISALDRDSERGYLASTLADPDFELSSFEKTKQVMEKLAWTEAVDQLGQIIEQVGGHKRKIHK